MGSAIVVSLLVPVLALGTAGATAGLTAPAGPSERLIVAVAPGSGGPVARAVERAGARVMARHDPGSFLVAEAPAGVARALASLPGVRFVEPDVLASVDLVGAGPDDPHYAEQWSLPKIGALDAWKVTGGSSELVVGVMDTGIDLTHPDLVDRLWRNPGEQRNGRDDDGNGFVDDIHGADCRDGASPQDQHDHGTHVAGIIGASVGNGIGIAGVDPRVRIMALRFMGPDGRGRISDAIRCMDYAISHGARITNHSWGTATYSRVLEEAVERARAAGMLIVASAGNNGVNLDTGAEHYPSGFPQDNVIAVASTTSYDSLAASSNHGIRSVHLAAPGVGILSTVRGGYAKRSGTSMAAPHVSGAAALIMAAHPGLGYRQVVERLLGSVERTLELESKVSSGGRLDIARAVEHDARPPAEPVLHSLTALRTGSSVSIAWLAPDEDGRVLGTRAVSRYELQVRRRGTSAWVQVPAPWPAPPGVPQRATIEGLRSATSYDVRLTAIDNVGNRATSEPIIATTSS